MFRSGIILVVSLGLCILISTATASDLTTHWGGDAKMVYDNGFMHKLMKHPDGGICLFNMDLIENDAPGSGRSEKGVSSDTIWGSNRAKKCY